MNYFTKFNVFKSRWINQGIFTLKAIYIESLILFLTLNITGCVWRAYSIYPKELDIYLEKSINNNKLSQDIDLISKYRQELASDISVNRRVQIYLSLGGLFYKHQMYNDAVIFYEEVLELKPKNIEAHFNLGKIYFIMDILTSANKEFDMVLDLDPQAHIAYYYRGRVFQKLGLYKEAERNYLESLKIEKRNAETHYYLGIIYQNRGELDKAEQEFLGAVELGGKLKNMYLNNLGYVYFLKNETEKAILTYNEILKNDPEQIDAYLNLGFIYYDTNNLIKAQETFTKVIKLDPQNGLAYFIRGLCYYKQGSVNQFNQDILKAQELGTPGVIGEFAQRALEISNMSGTSSEEQVKP